MGVAAITRTGRLMKYDPMDFKSQYPLSAAAAICPRNSDAQSESRTREISLEFETRRSALDSDADETETKWGS